MLLTVRAFLSRPTSHRDIKEPQEKSVITGQHLKRSVQRTGGPEDLLQRETSRRRRGLPVTCEAPQSHAGACPGQPPKSVQVPAVRPFVLWSPRGASHPVTGEPSRTQGQGCGRPASVPSPAPPLPGARRPATSTASQSRPESLGLLLLLGKQEAVSWSSSPDGAPDFPHAQGKSFRPFLSGNLFPEWFNLFSQCPCFLLSFLQRIRKMKPKQMPNR